MIQGFLTYPRDKAMLMGAILTYFAMLYLPSCYAATFEADSDRALWSVHATKLSCQLTHEIPNYGKAVFAQVMGERQTFALESILGAEEGMIVISNRTAAWDKPPKREELVRIPAQMGAKPLALNKATVYQLLNGLKKGWEPTFEITTKKQGVKQSKDTVVLSSAGFQQPYQEYLKCLDDMVPFTYEQIKTSTIHFPSGSKYLSDEDKARLQAVADLSKNDKSVYKVKLEGHSDSKGSYTSNRRLSYERAWFIKDYLVDYGVKPELIEVNGWADRKPIGKNRKKEGRALNRRVEVTVYR